MIRIPEALPGLARTLDELDALVSSGRVDTPEEFVEACHLRWTEETIAAVDALIPHWSAMASFADGKTLWHVCQAMIALRHLDEFTRADRHQRNLLEWTVLLHDIAKEPQPRQRDHRHAFRSAAVAARYLPRLDFATTELYASDFEAWFELTNNAHHFDDTCGAQVQDNRYLSAVLDGADRMFAPSGANLVKAIALHLSVTAVATWPSPAPLTTSEEHTHLTPDVTVVLLPLMLADNGGWNLFDHSTLLGMYAETRTVFARIGAKRAK